MTCEDADVRGQPLIRAVEVSSIAAKKSTLYHYSDFGPTLAVEKLAFDGYVLDHEPPRKAKRMKRAKRRRSR